LAHPGSPTEIAAARSPHPVPLHFVERGPGRGFNLVTGGES
jgi:hypothetical protein